ncbi:MULTISPECIES: GNAT family N-acetyltransferase [unclassified Haladaptatus]|nr:MULTISPECIES: GNAT family N-acetyltransferase [unclassified Haladaptatus]
MSSDVTIRPVKSADVPAIQRIGRAAYEAAYVDIVGQDEVDAMLAAWYDAEKLEGYISNEETAYYVAEGDEVVGFASGGPSDEMGEGELYAIYVHPDHWGDGVGTKLLSRIESTLTDRGMTKLRLEVFEENDVGRQFYEARGFERVSTKEADLFTGATPSVVVYAKALA